MPLGGQLPAGDWVAQSHPASGWGRILLSSFVSDKAPNLNTVPSINHSELGGERRLVMDFLRVSPSKKLGGL